MLNVVCVNAGNYLGRGAEYVEHLRRGVGQHLSQPFNFRVFTEEDLPEGLSGWWAKLFLFARGQFEGRVLYLDLDTVITGSLNEIAAYDGPFTVLRDFYRPFGLGSGLMAWTGDECADIWENWLRCGCPHMPGGDQQWIEMSKPQAELWQDKFPGRIVSYKAHCMHGVPGDASIVCFHGLPRPHETHLFTPRNPSDGEHQ